MKLNLWTGSLTSTYVFCIMMWIIRGGVCALRLVPRNNVFYSVAEPILVGPDQIYNGRMVFDGPPLVGTASNIVFDGDVYFTSDSEVVTSNVLRDAFPVLHLFSPSEAVRKRKNFFSPKKVIRMNFKKAQRIQKMGSFQHRSLSAEETPEILQTVPMESKETP